jgi:hypothetical protein
MNERICQKPNIVILLCFALTFERVRCYVDILAERHCVMHETRFFIFREEKEEYKWQRRKN